MLVRFAVLLMLTSLFCACSGGGPRAQQGTAIGALTGAGIGAIIGQKNGEGSEGAIIGALAGATVGNAIGDSEDRMVESNRAFIKSRTVSPNSVTQSQIMQMVQSGMEEDVIERQIQINGIAFTPTTDDLINLRNQGVSSRVIMAVQNAAKNPPAVSANPVVVERVVPVRTVPRHAPLWYDPHCDYYHHHYRPRRHRHKAGLSIHF